MHFIRRGGRHAERLYTPALLLLIFIVGTSFLGMGFVLPLRALYGREIGASSGEIGLMASAAMLSGFLTAPAVGWLSDRFGHGNILSLGVLAHTLLVLAYIPVRDPGVLIGLRALEGIAAVGVLPPARALVNSLAPHNRQAEALGGLSAAQTVGILLGPTLGLLLASQVGYQQAFIVASIPLAAGAFMARFFLPRRGKAEELAAETSLQGSGLFTPPLMLAYALQMVISAVIGVGAASWTIYMADRGASPLLIGLSFTTFAVPIVVLAPVTGRLADRHGRYWFVLIGLACVGALFVVYGLPIDPIWLVILSVPEGIAAACARSGVDGLLADATPAHLRGKVQANYSAAGTGSAFLIATISGFVYGIAPGLPFMLVGAIYLAAALALLLPGLAKLLTPIPARAVESDEVSAPVSVAQTGL
jgi:MFS family permease